MTRVSKPSRPLLQRRKKAPTLLKQFAPAGTRINSLIGCSKAIKPHTQILPSLSVGMFSAASAWEQPTSGYPRNLWASLPNAVHLRTAALSNIVWIASIQTLSSDLPLRYESVGLMEPDGAERDTGTTLQSRITLQSGRR